MKVKLLVKRDGCAAGTVVDYGQSAARELIGKREAVEFIAPTVPEAEKIVPKGPEKPVTKAPAKGQSTKED
jgi:hypothetical protein